MSPSFGRLGAKGHSLRKLCAGASCAGSPCSSNKQARSSSAWVCRLSVASCGPDPIFANRFCRSTELKKKSTPAIGPNNPIPERSSGINAGVRAVGRGGVVCYAGAGHVAHALVEEQGQQLDVWPKCAVKDVELEPNILGCMQLASRYNIPQVRKKSRTECRVILMQRSRDECMIDSSRKIFWSV